MSRVQLPHLAPTLPLPSCAPAELRRHRRRCVKLRSGESAARFGSFLPRRAAASVKDHIRTPTQSNTTALLSSSSLCSRRPVEMRGNKRKGEGHRSAVNSLQQRPRQQQSGSRTEDAEPASPLPLSVRMLRTSSPDPRWAMTASSVPVPAEG